jgi:hypothetical protein
MALTDAQHAVLQDLGNKIAIANDMVRKNNARVFEYWWSIGKELEKSEYHTGKDPGSIAREDMLEICQDLGLSTRIKRTTVHGSVTVNMARKLAREHPTKRDLEHAVKEYKAWAYYGSPSRARRVSEENKGKGYRSPTSKAGRTPYNVRAQVFDPAVLEFMASTGEDEARARDCLFGALRELGVDELVRLMKQYHENHPLVQSVA